MERKPLNRNIAVGVGAMVLHALTSLAGGVAAAMPKPAQKRAARTTRRTHLVWMPSIRDGIATMKSGRKYRITDSGWRRLN